MTDHKGLIKRLDERAQAARREGTMTAKCDANHFEEAAAALATAQAQMQEAVAVEVKPLEWDEYEGKHYCSGLVTGSTYSAAASVHVDHAGEFRLKGPWTDFRYYPSLEAAKAAAQADYEHRILSAITTKPASEARADTEARGTHMNTLTFGALRQANNTRQMEWPGNDKADVAFRAIEVAGEFGEVSEAVKKHLRAERGIKGSTATPSDVADEMADAIIALDLLAAEMGIDLSEAVARKFNLTSVKYGLQTRLPDQSS
ncbi:MazG-like family protein [Thioclava sp.]|uniref:MazG-like family protein n=1 Tax=Thioclava sp. TaxID=1933450 RepID=UPI0032422A1A